ncbi:aminopeptidase [Candidatus Woesearchaeota archaeon]|nr:aminopeptidase [Candidatus Woesearchaeota archaeon]
MLSDEVRRFLERHNLIDMAKSSVKVSERVFKECVVPKRERILIIGDVGASNRRISPALATSFYLAAKNLKLNADLFLQTPVISGQKANEAVVGAMDKLDENSIILMFLSSRLGEMGNLGNSFRSFVKSRNHRFMSAPSLGCLETSRYADLIKAIDVDYDDIRKRGQKLKETFDSGSEVHVTTKAGTDFTMSIDGVNAISNTAEYFSPGSGGNMPCGEVYMHPKGKENVSGKVVVDVSLCYREGTRLLKRPVTLFLENGELVKMSGSPEGLYLRDTITWAESRSKNPENVKKVCELGIGINKQAKCFGATILDEKSFGTAHIAFGSNFWFGGPIYALTHFDQVFRSPKIEVDGKVVKV